MNQLNLEQNSGKQEIIANEKNIFGSDIFGQNSKKKLILLALEHQTLILLLLHQSSFQKTCDMAYCKMSMDTRVQAGARPN